MASTFLTLPTPFLHKTSAASFSNRRLPHIFYSSKLSLLFTNFFILHKFLTFFSYGPLSVLKSNSLKVNAIAKKWEPAKVVPQADRVLIRLEELSEKTAGGILLPKSAVKFERYLVGEVLDFFCGSNDFGCLMKSKLEQTGKLCSFKNYELFQAKNDFNFEKRDWMSVNADELPDDSQLVRL